MADRFDSSPTRAVVVMRQQVAASHHQRSIRVAAQDSQSPDRATAHRLEAREDSVSREDEIAAERPGHSRWPQPFRPDNRNRKKAKPSDGLELQPWRQQATQRLRRQRVGQREALTKMGVD